MFAHSHYNPQRKAAQVTLVDEILVMSFNAAQAA